MRVGGGMRGPRDARGSAHDGSDRIDRDGGGRSAKRVPLGSEPMTASVSARANVRWVLTAQGGRLAVQFVSIAVLSRLLSPADYGLMAMATVVTNFAMLFRDMGTSTALIQMDRPSAALLDAVFSFNIVFGAVIAAAVALCAPLAAWAFSAESLTGLLVALSLTFPVAAASAAPLALLEREGKFRAVAWIEISSGALGLTGGIAGARAGLGAYSLAMQAVMTAALTALQVWGLSRWRPRLRWAPRELRPIWPFSSNLVAFNLVNYFVRNADTALVGRFFDAHSLGWYSVANRLLLFPLQNLTYVASRALLPVYSRRQNEKQEIGSLYLRTLAVIAAISAPMMFGLWALREPFVATLLGPKWSPVADILQWFAPTGFLQSIGATSGTVLSAVGRTDVLRKIGIANTAVLICAFIVGMQFGLLGLVEAYFMATCVLTLAIMHVVLGHVGCNLGALVRRVQAPVACAAAMAVLLACVNAALVGLVSQPVRLIVLVPIGALFYLLLLSIFARGIVREFLSLGGIPERRPAAGAAELTAGATPQQGRGSRSP